MRVITVDGWRKARAIAADGFVSSSRIRFLDWAVGETIVILVAREGILAGQVSGPRFRSDRAAWDTSPDDWRVPIAGVAPIEGVAGQSLNAGVRDTLKRCYGEDVYFRLLLSGMRLGEEPERLIQDLLRNAPGSSPPPATPAE